MIVTQYVSAAGEPAYVISYRGAKLSAHARAFIASLVVVDTWVCLKDDEPEGPRCDRPPGHYCVCCDRGPDDQDGEG